MKKVIVQHRGGVGNIIQTIPLLKYLLREYEVWLSLLQADYQGTAELFENWSRRVENLHIGEPSDGIRMLLPYINDSTSPITKKPVIWHDGFKIGESQVYMKMATDKEVSDIDCVAPLHSDSPIMPRKPFVVCWPGCKGGWPVKAYPHFGELMGKLHPFAQVVLVGKEPELFFDGPLPATTLNLVGMLDLSQLAGLVKEASAFVGNDGGISHLAATTGTQTFIVFGPTSVEKNKPWCNNAHAIVSSEELDCRPCQPVYPGFQKTHCHLFRGRKCLEIDPTEIIEKARTCL